MFEAEISNMEDQLKELDKKIELCNDYIKIHQDFKEVYERQKANITKALDSIKSIQLIDLDKKRGE